MPNTEFSAICQAIHDAKHRLVLALTGGGSGAIAALLQTPGASRTMLEAVVPYSFAALADWLGSPPEQACSSATARAMAMTAWLRAAELSMTAGDTTQSRADLLGVGVTASLATDRVKRGSHRVHIAVQSLAATSVSCVEFDAEVRDRRAEEESASWAILLAIGSAAGLDVTSQARDFEAQLSCDESLTRQSCQAPPGWSELLLGQKHWLFAAGSHEKPRLIFPGAFNPVHAGHLHMASVAQKLTGARVAWELSIANVDKAPLDYLTIDERVDGLTQASPDAGVLLTRAATFREKAKLFPGSTFVVGVDTIVRIADTRYYENKADRDEALAQIAERGCRFLVFGRIKGQTFESLDAIELPHELRRLCDGVPENDFREDVSSTAIRQAEAHGANGAL